MQKSNNYSRGKKSYSARSNNPNNNRRSTQFGGQRRRSNNKSRGQYINPDKYINHNTVTAEVVEYEPNNLFDDIGLSQKLVNNISKLGYKKPSAIQDQTIPVALKGEDVVGLANTGTGKTAAFLLPIINNLIAQPDYYSVLIIAPTRELAQQIDAEFKRFSSSLRLYSTVCVGGVNIMGQIRELKRRPHVIIGTPGRLKDLLERDNLSLDKIKYLVLDEADRMLDMGFVNDIQSICSKIPGSRQTMCFSATTTPSVKKIINELLKNPVEISVVKPTSSSHIYQDVIRFDGSDNKQDLLLDMLKDDEFKKVVIFGETKYGVQRLSDTLIKKGISSVAIHGNKSQSQRERALRSFKSEKASVLVATDVAARGLDIPNVSHVVNYDTPQNYEDYIHRIGRTGRAGKAGKAYTFIPSKA